MRRKHTGLGPKAEHGSEFRRLSFCLIYPRLSAEEPNNLEISVGAVKINLQEKSALSSQRTKQGAD